MEIIFTVFLARVPCLEGSLHAGQPGYLVSYHLPDWLTGKVRQASIVHVRLVSLPKYRLRNHSTGVQQLSAGQDIRLGAESPMLIFSEYISFLSHRSNVSQAVKYLVYSFQHGLGAVDVILLHHRFALYVAIDVIPSAISRFTEVLGDHLKQGMDGIESLGE